MEQLNNLDVVFLIIVGISALVGIARGMTKEILSILGWVLAAAAVFYITPIVDPMMHKYISSSILSSIVSGMIILIVFCIIWVLTVDRLAVVIRTSKLSALDRIFGFVFGIARGVLIVILVALMISTIIPEDSQKGVFADSKYFKVASNSAEPLKKLIPQSWIDKFKATSESLGLEDKEDKKDDAENKKDEGEKKREDKADTIQKTVKNIKDIKEAVDNFQALKKSGEELFNELAQPKPAEGSDENEGAGNGSSSDLDRLLDVLEDRFVETNEATPGVETDAQSVTDKVKNTEIKENVADKVSR